ncbi:hypothetical protein BDZ89DRAFT_1065539 [Hymenopellis radicata]|nr:hypothetical protein BDZ89DRAFT_1071016 [Hymenopellis radicata]KAF9029375.1 hypothetical protein BDZ89DRAFT_1065539 [Hymenopellis radicata]
MIVTPAGYRIRNDAVLLAAGGAVKLHIDHQHYERIPTTTTSPPPRPEHGDDDDICGMTPRLGPRPRHGSDDAATIHPNNCSTTTTRHHGDDQDTTKMEFDAALLTGIVARTTTTTDPRWHGYHHAHWQHDDHYDESPQPSRQYADLDLWTTLIEVWAPPTAPMNA